MGKLENIKKIINPSSIAIIGASQKVDSVGFNILKNIKECGYKGAIFPINLKYDKILGIKTYSSVLDVKNNIDLAIIAIPNTLILPVIEECHQKGITSLLIISAGFKESGLDGEILEKQILEKIKKYGMNCVGPNSIGILNLNNNFNGSFIKNTPNKGKIALISQSGALCCGIMNSLDTYSIGISKMISVGNQADLNINDFIEYFANDDEVEEIVLYLESIVNPIQFRKICLKTIKKKPIFALKAGRSESGSNATLSHTGSLAGNDGFADAILKQSGVIREIDLKDILNSCYIHSLCKNAIGKNIVIMTNGMGPAILAADKFSDYGLKLANLSLKTKNKLKEVLSPLASVNNPIDMITSAGVKEFENTLKILLEDKSVDTILLIYLELSKANSSEIQKSVEKIKKDYPKKNIVCSYITSSKEYEYLVEKTRNVPIFRDSDDAVKAIVNLYKFDKNKLLPNTFKYPNKIINEQIYNIISHAKKENRHLLTTAESLDVIKLLEIPTAPYLLVKTKEDIINNYQNLIFPVVLKISSKTLSHKTDVKGVIINIQTKEKLLKEFTNLKQRLKEIDELKNIDAFIIQPMCKSNRELIIGCTRDNNYGPVIMFGQGGIFVEKQNDVSFKISPLNDKDIDSLITETNIYKLIGNIRGLHEVDKMSLLNCIKKVDAMISTYTEIKEMDINPLLIDDNSGNLQAVDARIIID